jgi:hypothetical protein
MRKCFRVLAAVNMFDLVVKLLPKKSDERSELFEGLFKA